MPLTKYTANTAIIAALADLPNATSGLTPAQLKAKFDESPTALKAYINDVLTVELDTILSTDDADLAAHKISGDHDTRYYTETELNAGQLDTRYYTETEVDANLVTKSDLTTTRKLSATGDFTGTLNGAAIVASEPGLSSLFTALSAEYAKEVAAVFNVKGYGAIGDGVADDTTAIKAAIEVANTAGGGIVYFPTGSYRITSTIINLYNKVFLQGDGQGGTTTIFSNTDIVLIQLGVYISGVWDSSQWRYYQEIHGIDFQNRYVTPTQPSVQVAACQFVRIENCSFTDGYAGIKVLRYSDHGKYMNNVFYNLTYGIDVFGEAGITSTGCRYDGNDFHGGTIGLRFTGSFGDIQIHDNTFIGPTYGIRMVTDGTTTYSNKIGIYNNDFDGDESYGVYLEGCNHTIIDGNNMATDPTIGIGIWLRFCQNVDVANNNITASVNGIRILSGLNNNVSDNMIINAIGFGVILETNATDMTIENNRINSYLDCIRIADSTCTNNRFRFNNCVSTTGTDITTFDNDYTNIFMDESGGVYKIYDPVITAGRRSKVGEFAYSRNFSGITSDTVYTQLFDIDMDTYMSGRVELMFSVFLAGAGAGSHRFIEIMFGRISTGVVDAFTIKDQQSAVVFDLSINVATSGHLRIEIRRNAVGGGTEIRGSVVARVMGAIKSITSL